MVTAGCDLWETPECDAASATDIAVAQRAAAQRGEAGVRPAVRRESGPVVARVVIGLADVEAVGATGRVMVAPGIAVATAAALAVDVEVVGVAAAAAAPSAPSANLAGAVVEIVGNVVGLVASVAGADLVAAVKAAGES